MELFETTGQVELAEILFEGARSKGCGVVQFSQVPEAETAIGEIACSSPSFIELTRVLSQIPELYVRRSATGRPLQRPLAHVHAERCERRPGLTHTYADRCVNGQVCQAVTCILSAFSWGGLLAMYLCRTMVLKLASTTIQTQL